MKEVIFDHMYLAIQFLGKRQQVCIYVSDDIHPPNITY